MTQPSQRVEIRTKWLKLGVAIAFVHYVFLLLLVFLLEFDLYLALTVAVVGSIVGGIALMLFVLYVY